MWGRPLLSSVAPLRSMGFVLSFLYFISVLLLFFFLSFFCALCSFSLRKFLRYAAFYPEGLSGNVSFYLRENKRPMFSPFLLILSVQHMNCVPLHSHLTRGLQTDELAGHLDLNSRSSLAMSLSTWVANRLSEEVKKNISNKKTARISTDFCEIPLNYAEENKGSQPVSRHTRQYWVVFFFYYLVCLYQTHASFSPEPFIIRDQHSGRWILMPFSLLLSKLNSKLRSLLLANAKIAYHIPPVLRNMPLPFQSYFGTIYSSVDISLWHRYIEKDISHGRNVTCICKYSCGGFEL